jgi:signal transduction histidine kinase
MPRKAAIAPIASLIEGRPRVALVSACPPGDRIVRRRPGATRRLVGEMAHDINNLMTAIALNSDVLADSVTEARLIDLAETTRLCAQRAGELTRQLLAAVRDRRVAARRIDVNATILALRSLLHRTLGKRIDLQLVTDAQQATALLDPGKLEAAILNLALNARDAMPHGGRLIIRTANIVDGSAGAASQRAGPTGDRVVISVSDDGVGMTPAVAARAAEPFFTTRAEQGGTGLGLSAVGSFVHKAGGELAIETLCGAGTTVRMILPIATGGAPAGRA